MIQRRSVAASAPRRAGRVHGDIQGERGGAYDAVYALVRRIPKGRVMTYGQIATLVENRLSARAVGWAMHGCPNGVPWQRVVNASGGCSTDRVSDLPQGLQQALLEAEGVAFSAHGRLDLDQYRWVPPEERLPSDASRARRKPPRRTAARRAVTRT